MTRSVGREEERRFDEMKEEWMWTILNEVERGLRDDWAKRLLGKKRDVKASHTHFCTNT